MPRTTLDKLRRYVEIHEAKENGTAWYVNPKGHPLPEIPSQRVLEGEYLTHTIRSNPLLNSELPTLINTVRKIRMT